MVSVLPEFLGGLPAPGDEISDLTGSFFRAESDGVFSEREVDKLHI